MSKPDRSTVRALLANRPPLPIPDVLPEGKRIETAVLVPLVVAPEPSVTMMVRARGLRHHAGEVCFPGGKREQGDASLEQTALREAHEEIGLSPDAVDVVGALSPVPVATSRYRIHPFVGWVAERAAWRASPEVDRVVELRLDDLSSGRIEHRAVRMQWAGHEILSPFFVLEGDTRLYGASAFVLVELMSAIGPALGFTLPRPKVQD